MLTKKNYYEEQPFLRFSQIFIDTLKIRYGFFKENKNENVKNYSFMMNNKNNQDLVVVVLWGEAARGDHWQLNGYNRKTNPLLSKEKNLVNFSNAHSCRLTTDLSFSCMITGYNDPDNYVSFPVRETAISFFKKAGFVTSFLSAGANDLNTFIAHDMQDTTVRMATSTFSNDYRKNSDEKLIPMLQEVFDLDKHKGVPNFILMTSMGSHFDYEKRVPDEYQIFKSPYNTPFIDSKGRYCYVFKNKRLGEIIDSYDATILYTDKVISSIIDNLRDKNAVFIYASDHGESFGERGQSCLHGVDEPEVWHIPFMIWVSDIYIKKHPKKWNALLQSQKLEKTGVRMVSHDNIIHSILGAADIESDFMNKDLDLFSIKYPVLKNKFEGCSRFKDKKCTI